MVDGRGRTFGVGSRITALMGSREPQQRPQQPATALVWAVHSLSENGVGSQWHRAGATCRRTERQQVRPNLARGPRPPEQPRLG
eukprot:635023-Lingulodinium_polyedra.AAC.1